MFFFFFFCDKLYTPLYKIVYTGMSPGDNNLKQKGPVNSYP